MDTILILINNLQEQECNVLKALNTIKRLQKSPLYNEEMEYAVMCEGKNDESTKISRKCFNVATSLTSLLLFHHPNELIYSNIAEIWSSFVYHLEWIRIELISSGFIHNFLRIFSFYVENSLKSLDNKALLQLETTLIVLKCLSTNLATSEHVQFTSEVLNNLSVCLQMNDNFKYLSIQPIALEFLYNILLQEKLSHHHSTLRESCLEASENNQSSIIHLILTSMNSFLNDSQHVQLYGMKCLCIISDQEQFCEVIMNEGGIDTIVHSSSCYIQMELLQVLAMQCLEAVIGRERLMEENNKEFKSMLESKVESLCFLFNAFLHAYPSNYEIVKSISAIIKCFLFTDEAAVISSLLQHEIISNIFHLLMLYDENEEVSIDARTSLSQIVALSIFHNNSSIRKHLLLRSCKRDAQCLYLATLMFFASDVNFSDMMKEVCMADDVALVDCFVCMLLAHHHLNLATISFDDVKHIINDVLSKPALKNAFIICASLLRLLVEMSHQKIDLSNIMLKEMSSDCLAFAFIKTTTKNEESDMFSKAFEISNKLLSLIEDMKDGSQEILDCSFITTVKEFVNDKSLPIVLHELQLYHADNRQSEMQKTKVEFKEHLHISFDEKDSEVAVFSPALPSFESVVICSDLDVSNCNIETTKILFDSPSLKEVMKQVKILTLNNNRIFMLFESHAKILQMLEELNLENNCFVTFPTNIIIKLLALKTLDMSKNRIEKIEDVEQQEEDIKDDTFLPKAPSEACFYSLTSISLHHNKLTNFPFVFATCMPYLVYLDLSYNMINSIIPVDVANSTFKNLENLALSHNNITTIDQNLIKYLPKLRQLDLSWNEISDMKFLDNLESNCKLSTLNISHNVIKNLPTTILLLSHLKMLNASFNVISSLNGLHKCQVSRVNRLDLSHNCITDVVEFLSIFCGPLNESLHSLDLSNNKIEILPKVIGSLKSLERLNVARNKLTTLPNEIGKLQNLFLLDLKGNLIDIPEDLLCGSTKDIVFYLYSQLKNSEADSTLRMLMMGEEGATLAEKLTGVDTSEQKINLIPITKTTFSKREYDLEILVASYNSILFESHPHLFFCKRQVLVLVADALSDFACFSKVLLEANVYVSKSPVILIGTYSREKVSSGENDSELKQIVQKLKLFLTRFGFPSSSTCFLIDLNVADAKQLILSKIEGFISNHTVNGENMFENLIPKNFILLMGLLKRQAKLRHVLPILSFNEIISLMEEADVKMEDGGELLKAVSYLQDAGYLLHYEDPRNDLNNYFFLDTLWFLELLENILEQCIYLTNTANTFWGRCLMPIKSLKAVIESEVNKSFHKNCAKIRNAVYQMMCNSGIVIGVYEDKVFLPTLMWMFRKESDLLEPSTEPINRIFAMDFIPPSLWIYFTAHVLHFLPILLAKCFDLPRMTNYFDDVVIKCHERRFVVLHKNTFIVEVKGIFNEVLEMDSIVLTISTKVKITQIFLPFLVESLENIIEDRFDELLEPDIRGECHVHQYIPCPNCLHLISRDSLSLMSKDEILNPDQTICTQCKANASTVTDFVPDIFFNDIDVTYQCNPALLYVDKKDGFLGKGGFGSVYKGKYKTTEVAVKEFRCLDSIHPHKSLRNELSVLVEITHPSIVTLLGFISLSQYTSAPMLVMEFASIGSLADKISQMAKQENQSFPIALKQRILLEVIQALDYLHNHHIMFRDLKTDNVLFFSKDILQPVVVKLTDFGISLKYNSSGLVSACGSPGYSAPEVVVFKMRNSISRLYASPYNEKSDIFSYGMLVHEVAVAKSPWFEYGDTTSANEDNFSVNFPDEAVLKGHLPVAVSSFDKFALCPRIQSIISSCLQRNPNKRPSAHEISNKLSDPLAYCYRFQVPILRFNNLTCLPNVIENDLNRELFKLWTLNNDISSVILHSVSCDTFHGKTISHDFSINIGNESVKAVTCGRCKLAPNKPSVWKPQTKNTHFNCDEYFIALFVATSQGKIVMLSADNNEQISTVKEISVGFEICSLTFLQDSSCLLVGTTSGKVLMYIHKQITDKSDVKRSAHSIDLAWFIGAVSVTNLFNCNKIVYAVCGRHLAEIKVKYGHLIMKGTKLSALKNVQLEYVMAQNGIIAASSESSDIVQIWNDFSAMPAKKLSINNYSSNNGNVSSLLSDDVRRVVWIGTTSGEILCFSITDNGKTNFLTKLLLFNSAVSTLKIINAPQTGDVLLCFGNTSTSLLHSTNNQENGHAFVVIDADLPIVATSLRTRQDYHNH